MPTETRPLASVSLLISRDADSLHRDLLKLAEAAQRGEITGIAYTAITPCGRTLQGLMGRARTDLARAYMGAQRLARSIMDASP